MRHSAIQICGLISSLRSATGDESVLQAGIAQALSETGIAFQPEVALSSKNRIDFLLENGIGIETKIDGAVSAVTRQLFRYAESDRITELILITTKARHLSIERTLNGKTVYIAHLKTFL